MKKSPKTAKQNKRFAAAPSQKGALDIPAQVTEIESEASRGLADCAIRHLLDLCNQPVIRHSNGNRALVAGRAFSGGIVLSNDTFALLAKARESEQVFWNTVEQEFVKRQQALRITYGVTHNECARCYSSGSDENRLLELTFRDGTTAHLCAKCRVGLSWNGYPKQSRISAPLQYAEQALLLASKLSKRAAPARAELKRLRAAMSFFGIASWRSPKELKRREFARRVRTFFTGDPERRNFFHRFILHGAAFLLYATVFYWFFLILNRVLPQGLGVEPQPCSWLPGWDENGCAKLAILIAGIYVPLYVVAWFKSGDITAPNVLWAFLKNNETRWANKDKLAHAAEILMLLFFGCYLVSRLLK